MNRRESCSGASSIVAWAVLLVLFGGAPARIQAFEHEKPSGEPYTLAGKRLVFTTWVFVRPGQLDWVDDGGKGLCASRAGSILIEASDPQQVDHF